MKTQLPVRGSWYRPGAHCLSGYNGATTRSTTKDVGTRTKPSVNKPRTLSFKPVWFLRINGRDVSTSSFVTERGTTVESLLRFLLCIFFALPIVGVNDAVVITLVMISYAYTFATRGWMRYRDATSMERML